MLNGKRVVLGVTGSIAGYKALDLASKLTQAGALVDVIMSYGAAQFVTPLAFRSLTHRPVVTDAFDANAEYAVEHVELARQGGYYRSGAGHGALHRPAGAGTGRRSAYYYGGGVNGAVANRAGDGRRDVRTSGDAGKSGDLAT